MRDIDKTRYKLVKDGYIFIRLCLDFSKNTIEKTEYYLNKDKNRLAIVDNNGNINYMDNVKEG